VKDLALVLRRSFDVMVMAAGPLFLGGLAWSLLDELARSLLLGPALVGLFRVALRTAREEEASWADLVAAKDDPLGAMVAGVLFAAPFLAWATLDRMNDAMESGQFAREASDVPVIPFVLSLAVLVHFAYHVLAFAHLGDGERSVLACFRRSRDEAESAGRATGRWTPFGKHLLLTTGAFAAMRVAVWLGGDNGIVRALLVGLVGPAVVAVLATWQVMRTGSEGSAGEPPGASPEGDELDGLEGSAEA
jgi:hypothetical protein